MHLDPRKLHWVCSWAVLVRQSTLTEPLSLGVVDHLIAFFPPRKFGGVVHLDHPPLSHPPWSCGLSLIVVFDRIRKWVVLNYEDMPSTQNLGLHHIIFVWKAVHIIKRKRVIVPFSKGSCFRYQAVDMLSKLAFSFSYEQYWLGRCYEATSEYIL